MKNEYLRHTLATINYRFQKAVKDLENDIGDFKAGKGSRSPVQIINHMFCVLNATGIFLIEERIEKKIPEKLTLVLEAHVTHSCQITIDFG